MRLDFRRPETEDQILLRPDDEAWGPFEFSFPVAADSDSRGALPPGTTISSATGTAWLQGSDGTWTEVSDLVADVTVTGDSTLNATFQGFDSEDEALSSGTYYLQFHLTLDGGQVKTFNPGPVVVEAFG